VVSCVMINTPSRSIALIFLTGGGWGFEATSFATSVPGIYAVGDVRATSVKRVASAVGEGSVVISDIHRYIAQNRIDFSAQAKAN
jgi:thioredoxin reductase (NADPH)